jgi:hypothetical protein
MGKFNLDHIAPLSRHFYQTIVNFRPLCGSCNRAKASMLGENPFQVKLMLPQEFRTQDLDDIHRLAPPWLGAMRAPMAISQIDKTLGKS